ncbi:E3 ubiquitin-protein ligase RNF25 [Bufo bufo]|uniref:E3 ubiquitin-protein ligase RNF25 n=1 Tax=Bufo bufo TaxID=8384 RepID=UPI001ABDC56B|nr:E3 ubiquitin-protein ligase RNF25 [Bufo bufo]
MAEEQEEGSLSQELEVLQSIYLDELEVSQEERLVLRITLHPTTADNPETQYVRLTLDLCLPPSYPDEPPEIIVTNARGLCDEQIDSIISTLRMTAAQSVGCPILYALIEKCKEMLTASNLPRGHCVICLYEFQEDDCLTKTHCFHHFHSYCLGRYAKHCLENDQREEPVVCPVCRENLTCDFKKLQAATPPKQPEELYVPDLLMVQREKELRKVYSRQLANGGIIDLEAEKRRFFISIQETPASEHEHQELQPERVTAQPSDPGTESGQDPNLLPIVSKPHVQEHRPGIKTPLCGNRPFRNNLPDGQPWRDSRGWAARDRKRSDTRRVWREEAASKDDQTAVRGRVMVRSCRSSGTVQAFPGGSSEGSPREKPKH